MLIQHVEFAPKMRRRTRRRPLVILLILALIVLYRRWSVSTSTVDAVAASSSASLAKSAPSALEDVRQKQEPAPIDPASLHKMIVMAKTAFEDTRWVANELPGWNRSIYSLDDRSGNTIPLPNNKGREANAYLKYLVDHYDDLADVVVFLHAHRGGGGTSIGWHIDNEYQDNALSIKRLRLDTVVREGYANLRCQATPGCPVMFDTSIEEDNVYLDAYKATWPVLFPGEPIPDQLAVACCAQFAVSKAQIRQRPKSDYERYQKWLQQTPYDDHLAGTVLEYFWHIIFGRDAVHCPSLWSCYCQTFGEECDIYEPENLDVLDGLDAMMNDLKRREGYT